ncbi:GTPase HflX [Aquihabitans sp. G128]|uniref:GTPase HflX n=1 Tax=Aquihabitans sp. G128 TaxID=2849779 RepID=UPI001C23CC44|nr:GTPase HflX [Aquihabitans sp. G128]QXC62499.1 GTPase HflX [Aquihabitans sp. G128]
MSDWSDGPVPSDLDVGALDGPVLGPDGEVDDFADLLDAEGDEEESHRGAFGDYGGGTGALIDRTFREKIIIVGVTLGGGDVDQTEFDLDELALLVDTAGADVVGRIVQRRSAPDPATYLGKGKAEELKDLAHALDCDTVVFDDELSPAQQRNLEKLLGRTALDRTAVILDIFAQNASSVEGKAQVELAQLRYLKPRLRGKGQGLSQQAGGMSAGGGARVGSRGPGETQLETDRRRITRRIHKLEADLRGMAAHQDTQHKRRSQSRAGQVAIVGYTNAGKSTLLNQLSGAGVLVEDRLFATLDATTRRLQLPGGEAVLLTDTVGFVRKLPHQLVESFKSTLRVAGDADLLVHVVDGAAPDPQAHIDAVHDVLGDIGAGEVAELIVFNKADVAPDIKVLVDRHPGSVAISAVTGEGIEELLLTVGDRLRSTTNVVDLLIPFERGDVLAEVHREGEVLGEEVGEGGMRVTARLDEAGSAKLAPWVAS